jgi:3-hydroxybutyryl-CoA dehydrogenase
MHILVIGDENNLDECRLKFGVSHTYLHSNGLAPVQEFFSQSDVVFDFLVDQDRGLQPFSHYLNSPLFVNSAKTSMLELNRKLGVPLPLPQFGFAGLPTFLNRAILEVSLYNPEHVEKLTALCRQLGTPFQAVQDRVGLVTPRVICMIINEAYFTFQEGTATRENIDLAMKLGTHYPFGPFAWCQKIGVRHVYELLKAVYEDTGDERYRICPLLERESRET